MKHAFPWFAIHRETRYVIAGFAEFDDAERFCKSFTHGMYVAVSGIEIDPVRTAA